MTVPYGNSDALTFQMYTQNSFRPALLMQSMPRTVAVAPAKEMLPTMAPARVHGMAYASSHEDGPGDGPACAVML